RRRASRSVASCWIVLRSSRCAALAPAFLLAATGAPCLSCCTRSSNLMTLLTGLFLPGVTETLGLGAFLAISVYVHLRDFEGFDADLRKGHAEHFVGQHHVL